MNFEIHQTFNFDRCQMWFQDFSSRRRIFSVHPKSEKKNYNWLVVSTQLKNISKNGNLPQGSGWNKSVWNHHLDNYSVISKICSSFGRKIHENPWLPSSRKPQGLTSQRPMVECHARNLASTTSRSIPRYNACLGRFGILTKYVACQY